jgi:hypothetical protein
VRFLPPCDCSLASGDSRVCWLNSGKSRKDRSRRFLFRFVAAPVSRRGEEADKRTPASPGRPRAVFKNKTPEGWRSPNSTYNWWP